MGQPIVPACDSNGEGEGAKLKGDIPVRCGVEDGRKLEVRDEGMTESGNGQGIQAVADRLLDSDFTS